jgi:KAP family P-loop domain protein
MWKDSESNIDYIDFEYIADLVNEIIMDDSLLPASIGVYGDWGSGKSSIMSISQKALNKKDKDALIINFNSWLFEDYGDAKNTVINCILDQIEVKIKNRETLKDKFNHLRKSISIFELYTALIKNSSTIISSILNPLNIVGMAENTSADIVDNIEGIKNRYEAIVSHESLRNDVANFRNDFGNLIEESGISRVVIYVDEMDRCLPDTILEIFEAMRLFLFNGKVAFVFGADERQIAYAIRQKYSDSIFETEHKINIGKEYLEKIIQYPIRIPTMTVSETEMYLTLLFCSKILNKERFETLKNNCIKQFRTDTSKFQLPDSVVEFDNSDDISSFYSLSRKISYLLNSGLNGNPRQFKRFLNEFEMRKKVAKLKKIDIDEKVLVKMMILQYVKPNIFADFIDLYGKGNLNTYLGLYEVVDEEQTSKKAANSKNKSSDEKKWNDEWFERWMKEEPSIKEENLEPYFYLSRGANNVFNYSSSIKLSEPARKIIDAYMGEHDILIAQARDEINNISVIECNLIIEELYNAFITDSAKKNINVIKGLVEIALNKRECFGVVLSKLKLIPANSISKAMIVHINVLQEIDKNEINTLIFTWENDNPKLKKR